MIADHSVLVACIVGAFFFIVFYAGALNLGRERIK